MGCGIDRQAEKLADVTDDLTDRCIEKAIASENSTSLAFLVQNKTISFAGEI